MLKEDKILFENVKKFRHILTEAVSHENVIKDAIQNHEYLYIFYREDKESASGSRTIRPYALGYSATGALVLRAWQDNPRNSYHFVNRPTRNDSPMHDFWTDGEGIKPGWRMFRVDRILNVYPIGKKFHDKNGMVMIPSGYHEGADDDMSTVIISVSTKNEPDFEYRYDKDFSGDTTTKAMRDQERWDSIKRGNKNKRKITPMDVTKLRDIASRVFKKSMDGFYVVIDDKNNFQLITIANKDKYNIPDTAVLGTLSHLYDSLVKKNEPIENDPFFANGRKNAENLINTVNPNASTMKEEKKLPSIPFERKPFFKQ